MCCLVFPILSPIPKPPHLLVIESLSIFTCPPHPSLRSSGGSIVIHPLADGMFVYRNIIKRRCVYFTSFSLSLGQQPIAIRGGCFVFSSLFSSPLPWPIACLISRPLKGVHAFMRTRTPSEQAGIGKLSAQKMTLKIITLKCGKRLLRRSAPTPNDGWL